MAASVIPVRSHASWRHVDNDWLSRADTDRHGGLIDRDGADTEGDVDTLYFQVAAESHVPQAEHHLGIMYEYGLGVEEDFEKAAVFYRRATEKLHVESMYHLACTSSVGIRYN